MPHHRTPHVPTTGDAFAVEQYPSIGSTLLVFRDGLGREATEVRVRDATEAELDAIAAWHRARLIARDTTGASRIFQLHLER